MFTKMAVVVLCRRPLSGNNPRIGVNVGIARFNVDFCEFHLDPLRRAKFSCVRLFFALLPLAVVTDEHIEAIGIGEIVL